MLCFARSVPAVRLSMRSPLERQQTVLPDIGLTLVWPSALSEH
jgi:hypothetical protein